MSKLVAVMGGRDWCDASVTHIVVPDGMDLDEEKKQYEKWYDEVYVPRLHSRDSVGYMSLPEWLKSRGARQAGENDVIEIWEE